MIPQIAHARAAWPIFFALLSLITYPSCDGDIIEPVVTRDKGARQFHSQDENHKEDYRGQSLDAPVRESELAIEVGYHPGVTDPVAWHLLRRAHLMGIQSLQAVTTGMRYVFEGELPPQALHLIAREILCNNVIQSYTLGALQPAFVPHAEPSEAVDTIPLRQLLCNDSLGT
jgi:phosphoribosylformylglycinamidine (FGAM) synthase PurS component